MFLNGNLNILMIVILMTIITCSLSKGENRKSYQLVKTNETYADYRNRNILPNDDLQKMTMKEFYDTKQNVQSVLLPCLDDRNYDEYKKTVEDFCKNEYRSYQRFIVENTLDEFLTNVNILVQNIKNMIFQENQQNEQNNMKSIKKNLKACIELTSDQMISCVEKEFNKTNKLSEIQGYITEFKKNIRSIVSFTFGDLKFSKNMITIIGKMIVNDFNAFAKQVKSCEDENYTPHDSAIITDSNYEEYLGFENSQKKTFRDESNCNKIYKPFDVVYYISKRIGYHLFPRTNENSLKVFKNRRIQFVYHLSTLFKEMGIPNSEKFKSLLKATKSIDESYFNNLMSFNPIAKETYETYAMRIIVKGYYPLPEKLWKLEKNRK